MDKILTQVLTYPIIINHPEMEDIMKMHLDAVSDYKDMSTIGKIIADISDILAETLYQIQDRVYDDEREISYYLTKVFDDYQEKISNSNSNYFVWREYLSLTQINRSKATIGFMINEKDSNEIKFDERAKEEVTGLVKNLFPKLMQENNYRKAYDKYQTARFFILCYSIINKNAPLIIIDPEDLDEDYDEEDD